MKHSILLFLVISTLLLAVACDSKKTESPQPRSEISLDTLPNKTSTIVPKDLKPRFKPPLGWTEIREDERIHLDIRYATDNNFVHQVLYPCGRCYLRTGVAEALYRVVDDAQALGYDVVLYDCYRPAPVQQKLWDIVPNPSYVTPPKKGSMHNKGAAIDLGFTTLQGDSLFFGSPYDYFGPEAHQDYTKHPSDVNKRRNDLKSTMEKHGFRAIRTEWWHYSIPAYVNDKTSDWVWTCE